MVKLRGCGNIYMAIKVGILGSTGYTGAELLRILLNHPDVEVSWLTSEKFSGESISRVFPHFSGFIDIECQSVSELPHTNDADLVFSCLPHGTSARFVSRFLGEGSRVIDFSRDFRFGNAAIHKKLFKQDHKYSKLLKDAVYGLPELLRDKIRGAALVANPGCYSTAVILGLLPLAVNDLLAGDSIIADIKSGISGGGRAPTLSHHFSETNESLSAGPQLARDQEAEMEYKLSGLAGTPVKVTFVPHTVPINRGILATIYCQLNDKADSERIHKLYKTHYGEEPFVSVLSKGKFPGVKDVTYSNMCRIGLALRENMIVIVAALDNLGKGASGQAVQNMNIMFGFPENEGLTGPAMYP
jgi:N-acetyl-gamma-glutamyl-phosphate reductase